MAKVDALALHVKEMRSIDDDEAEQAMLDQLTHFLGKYKASQALGGSRKTLPVHHDDGPSATGIQGASFDSSRVDKQAEESDRPMWEEHVAKISRCLQASHRAETCVWRRGDDVHG